MIRYILMFLLSVILLSCFRICNDPPPVYAFTENAKRMMVYRIGDTLKFNNNLTMIVIKDSNYVYRVQPNIGPCTKPYNIEERILTLDVYKNQVKLSNGKISYSMEPSLVSLSTDSLYMSFWFEYQIKDTVLFSKFYKNLIIQKNDAYYVNYSIYDQKEAYFSLEKGFIGYITYGGKKVFLDTLIHKK